MPHTSYDLADISDENTAEMVINILDKTTYDVKLHYPESRVPLAFILFFCRRERKAQRLIGEIIEIAHRKNIPEEKRNAILGETELLISFTAYNDIAEMSRHHRKAYELLGKKASLINLRSTWSFGSPSVMCMYHAKTGSLERELELMDECMPYYYRLTGSHGTGSEFAMRAEAEFLRGNFPEAKTLAHRAAFEAKSKNQAAYISARCSFWRTLRLLRAMKRNFSTHFLQCPKAPPPMPRTCADTRSVCFWGIFTRSRTAPEKSTAEIGLSGTRLSPREREVAKLIRCGLTNKQIAARLYVSVSTVKMTVSNIFDKTGIRARSFLT